MKISKKTKQKIKRYFAFFMAINLLSEVIFPSVAMALTSGNIQPEYFGYQPVDATDNVNLSSGKFNYTVPVTSIPEFPMAIGYTPGLGMEAEASCFGYGFNGFSGAITRNMSGLPDDINNAEMHYIFNNQKKWDASLKGQLSAPIPGTTVDDYSGGASVSLTVGYNNYIGAYGAIGLGLGVQNKIGNDWFSASSGLGASLVSDSRKQGISYGIGASLGIQSKGAHLADQIGGYGYGGTWDKRQAGGKGAGFLVGVLGKSVFASDPRATNSSLASLAYVMPNSTGFGASVTVPFTSQFSVTGNYSQFKMADGKITKAAYGYEYLSNYNIANRDNIADMTIEGEDSYNNAARNAPSYLQNDNFNINTMGIGGSMRLYQLEYGMVGRNYNRNQYRNFQLTGIRTNRQETYPWYSVKKTKSNKSVDILALLKKKDNPEDKDFDNLLFEETEMVNFNNADHKFGNAQFKMRGDFAGEYNMSSANAFDNQPNNYSLTYINGTNDNSFFFLGHENGVPQYSPEISATDRQEYKRSSNTFERSTIIKKKTIGEMLGMFLNLRNVPSGSQDEYKLNQSIFSHNTYTVSPANDNASQNKDLNANSSKFCIIDHLTTLKNGEKPYFSDLTGSIEIQNTSGLKYYFGLPVFEKRTGSIQLKGRGKNPPVKDGSGYHSATELNFERGRVETQEDFMYPYAWLLTAVVGDDYVDFDDVVGPSDGDLGYWVKFKYTKAANDYCWRTPFIGLNHVAGKYHDNGDDAYFASSGNKEIYYLSEIESASYLCKYEYQKRIDGCGSKGLTSGEAFNPLYNKSSSFPSTTSNFSTASQFVVTQIDLFKKHTTGNNSEIISSQLTKIKSTKFFYDYSICKEVPNNIVVAGGAINMASFNYLVPGTAECNTRGKLTLRKVQHIAYDEAGTEIPLPSYQFKYWSDQPNPEDDPCLPLDLNPDYDKNMFDQWGNYIKGSKERAHRDGREGPTPNAGDGEPEVDYYTHYPEYIKSKADENAKVWNLKSIDLPSGGKMEIDYQAHSYGFVEDKTPFTMRHVFGVEEYGTNQTILWVDITDLREPGSPQLDLTTATTTNAAGEEKKILAVGDVVYGEIAFYKSNKNNFHDPAKLYISSGKVVVNAITNEISTAPYLNELTDRTYQKVIVSAAQDGGFQTNNHPFIKDCKTYMYVESEEARALKEMPVQTNCGNTDALIANYAGLEQATALSAANQIISNVRNTIQPESLFETRFANCYGTPGNAIYPHFSYLRTNIFKAKYTGCAVKSIRLSDNFNYGTNPDGSGVVSLPDNPTPQELEAYNEAINKYGTNYYYDLNENGTGTSAGVTPIEPGGGESCVIDALKLLGVGYAPGPNIVYAKTTVQNKYEEQETTTTIPGAEVSRDKGKTVYEFYTAKDPGFQFANHFNAKPTVHGQGDGNFKMISMFTWLVLKFKIFGKTVKIKIPIIVPIVLNWQRHDNYQLKSYSFNDYADMFGRPKSITQKDKANTQLGTQKFTYYGMNDPIDVANDMPSTPPSSDFALNASDFITPVKKPGRIDQSWSESFYTKESNVYYLALFLNANTRRQFNYTNMKYTYSPPVLKKVESNFDGLATSTENTIFDYYTGTPLEVKSMDSYNNTKIVRTVPAYWEYKNMGTAEIPAQPYGSNGFTSYKGDVNNFTATTGTYMYLNTVSSSSVLGAGVVAWSKNATGNNWEMTPYLQPKRNYTNANTYSYSYQLRPGGLIEAEYSSIKRNIEVNNINNKKPILRNSFLFKPYKGYTYHSDLSTNAANAGVFTNFGKFTYPNGPTQNQPANDRGWKLLSTNTLYSANGVLVESKDILNKYATQLLGYNFSNTIGAASNTSWGASVYEGAENTYSTIAGVKMLEADRVKLYQAEVIGSCQREFVDKELCTKDLPGTTIKTARVLTLTLPSNPLYNVPFGQFDVNIYNGTQTIQRSLFVSLSDDNTFNIVSNMGESFEGFFTLPMGNNQYKLIFDPDVITSASVNSIFPVPFGYALTYNSNESFASCPFGCRDYTLPSNNCGAEVHTGSFAFKLGPGKIGTYYLISKNNLNTSLTTAATEYMRKYKAYVWVHNSSPANTELVVNVKQNSSASITTPANTFAAATSTPYVTAGNWRLLRLDFDLTNYTTMPNVYVYVKNSSTGGVAIYDDIRILPYHAEMTNWVFEHKFNRVVSGLDNDHFASYSKYDARGRATESLIELQNEGKKTIQKFLYNDQKNN